MRRRQGSGNRRLQRMRRIGVLALCAPWTVRKAAVCIVYALEKQHYSRRFIWLKIRNTDKGQGSGSISGQYTCSIQCVAASHSIPMHAWMGMEQP